MQVELQELKKEMQKTKNEMGLKEVRKLYSEYQSEYQKLYEQCMAACEKLEVSEKACFAAQDAHLNCEKDLKEQKNLNDQLKTDLVKTLAENDVQLSTLNNER